ncbi:hypothetical protein [Arvimicrobium flavum]|uniref:hypothetical protein n=1 Tax=Arvimicrobium flavum TaxID=3393320 RepID=UPI00237AD593|nr:hypothetical protein [Mesorhizobium shangrilense]
MEGDARAEVASSELMEATYAIPAFRANRFVVSHPVENVVRIVLGEAWGIDSPITMRSAIAMSVEDVKRFRDVISSVLDAHEKNETTATMPAAVVE